MPPFDQMLLDEYLNEASDFRKAATTVGKVYDGLLSGSFKVVLGDYTVEATLRKLRQRVVELDNSIGRSKGNYKKIVKEIIRLHIDLIGLKNSLIEFLLLLRNRIHNYNGLFERYCTEYGLSIKNNNKDKSNLRWDHLRPNPNAVLGSLKYIEDFSRELDDSKRKYQDDLQTICQELRRLGMNTMSINGSDKPDFQDILCSVDQILGAVDISGLYDMTASISKFFSLATKVAKIFPDPDVKLGLETKSAESVLDEFELRFERKGKYTYVPLMQIAKLASNAQTESTCLITNASGIDIGFASLFGLVRILKQIQLCLPSATAFIVELSEHKNIRDTDVSEVYCKLASRIPVDLEHIPNYVTAAGIFKNLIRELELVFRS